MPIVNSGTVSLGDLQDEFGGTPPTELEEYYRGLEVPDAIENQNVPTSGTVSLSDYYGSQNITYIINLSFSNSPTTIITDTVPLQVEYNSPGTVSLPIPDYVNKVSTVLVGGGGGGAAGKANSNSTVFYNNPGGGGGALVWANDITVDPLLTYNVTVGSGGSGAVYNASKALGGNGGATSTNLPNAGIAYGGDGGGRGSSTNIGGGGGLRSGGDGGGKGGQGGYGFGAGGGGAGGYNGNGGTYGNDATGGAGGGGATYYGFRNYARGGGGGGVGIEGQGASGSRGSSVNNGIGEDGGGGSGGNSGLSGDGGTAGGGGAGEGAGFYSTNPTGEPGGDGAARVIYTGFNTNTTPEGGDLTNIPARSYPNTASDVSANVTRDGYDEGTVVTVTVSTTSIPDNTTLYYSIEYITGSGSNVNEIIYSAAFPDLTIQNNTASDTFTLGEDFNLEGQEEVFVRLRRDDPSTGTIVKESQSFVILDSSTPEIEITSMPSTITEGETLVVEFKTRGFTSGTSITYEFTGVSSSDVNGNLTGSVTHTVTGTQYENTHTISLGIEQDWVVGDNNIENETITFSITNNQTTVLNNNQTCSVIDFYYDVQLSVENPPIIETFGPYNTSGSITVPSGVNRLSAALVGGGGGGGHGVASHGSGGGGGGGALAWINQVPVTPGAAISYSVGSGGRQQELLSGSVNNAHSQAYNNAVAPNYSYYPTWGGSLSQTASMTGGDSVISKTNDESNTQTFIFSETSNGTFTYTFSSATKFGFTADVLNVKKVSAHGDLNTSAEYITWTALPSSYQNIFETGGVDGGTTNVWYENQSGLDVTSSILSNDTITFSFTVPADVNLIPGGASVYWYLEIEIEAKRVVSGTTEIARAGGGAAGQAYYYGGSGGGGSSNIGSSFANLPHGGGSGKSGDSRQSGNSGRYAGGGGGAGGYYGNIGSGGNAGRGLSDLYRADTGYVYYYTIHGGNGGGVGTTSGVGSTGADGIDYPAYGRISGQADDGNLVMINNPGQTWATDVHGGGGSGGTAGYGGFVTTGGGKAGGGGGGGAGGYMGGWTLQYGSFYYGQNTWAQDEGKNGADGEVSLVLTSTDADIYPENRDQADNNLFISEGDDLTVTFTVSPGVSTGTQYYWKLSPVPATNVNAVYDDFPAVNGTVTIDTQGTNESSVTFTIPSNADYFTEGFETYTVEIYNSSGVVLYAESESVTYIDTSRSNIEVSITSGDSDTINGITYVALNQTITLTVSQVGGTGLASGYQIPYQFYGTTPTSITGTLGTSGNFTIGTAESKTLTFTGGAGNQYSWQSTFEDDSFDGFVFEVIEPGFTLEIQNGITQVYEGESITLEYSSIGQTVSNTVPIEVSGTGVTPSDFTSGVNAADSTYAYTHAILTATGGFSGQSGSLTLTFSYDAFSEGNETVTFTLADDPGGENVSVTVLKRTYTLSSSVSPVDEGQSLTITLTTAGVESGENIDYRITGIQSADIGGQSLTGTMSEPNDLSRVYTISNDFITEGTETLNFEVGPSATPYDDIDVVINDTSVPTYTLSADAGAINEYETVTITLTTQGIPNGTSVPYTITGVQAGDITQSLTGSFTVNSNSDDLFIEPIFDNSIDGPETLTLSLDNGEDLINITINEPTFILSSNKSTMFEGESVTVTLTTTEVPDGTSIPYSVSGIVSSDLSSGSLSGNFVVNNNTATASWTLAQDSTSDSPETMTVTTNHNESISITVLGVTTFALSSSAATIAEGNTFTVTLSTTEVPDGAKVGYSISGVTAVPYLYDMLDNPNAYNTSASDRFGYSVAISGDYAIVGADLEDDAGGSSSGKAYIFDVTTGALLHTLDNPNAYSTSASDVFGRSVAIDGNYAIVGARLEDDGGTDSGKAYIYDISTFTTSTISSATYVLDNPTAYSGSAGDEFGSPVAISGNYAIVGAPWEDEAGGTNSGKAYIYDISTFTTSTISSATYVLDNPNAYDTSTSDLFGYSVAISGDYAIVGPRFEDDAGGSSSGKAYIYDISTFTTSTISSATYVLDNPNAYDTSAGDYFGNSVAISGDYAIVGAYLEDDAGGTGSGKAYIYDISTFATSTISSATYVLDNPNAYSTSAADYFGVSVAISGNRAIVGAYLEDDAGGSSSGKAYIFDVTTGALLKTLDNPNAYDTSASDNFGFSVAISSEYAVVGTYLEDEENNSSSGKVYVYNTGDATDSTLDVTTSSEYFTVNNDTATITVTANTNVDGYMYVVGDSDLEATVRQFNVSADLQSLVMDKYFNIPAGQGDGALGMYFRDNGTRVWLQDPSDDEFHQYTLSTPWDISTATSHSSASYGTSGGNHQGMWIAPSGTKLYQIDRNLKYILYDGISTWNPFSPGSPFRFKDISADTSLPTGIAVKPDGTRAFVSNLGTTGGDIVEFSGTADRPDLWTKGYELTQSGTFFTDIFVPDAGTTMYVTNENGLIYYYELSTAWDLSTASLIRTVDLSSHFDAIHAVYFTTLTSETFKLTLGSKDDQGNDTGSPTTTVNITG